MYMQCNIMWYLTDSITHTTVLVTPAVKHWLEQNTVSGHNDDEWIFYRWTSSNLNYWPNHLSFIMDLPTGLHIYFLWT